MNHDHSHHHPMPTATLNRAFAIGITLNLCMVAIEAFYGWKVNSLALLADAGHNLSDVAGLLLAWVAVWIGQWHPNLRHSYGWQRASVLAAFANAVLLLVAMGALAWEAIIRLQAPQPFGGYTVMVVAGIGIVINTLTALLFLRGQAGDINVRGAFLHLASDAAVSAAVMVAAGLYLLLGWHWVDPVMSLLIAFVIIVGSWGLLRQSLHLLFDGVPEHIDPHAVQSWLLSLQGVSAVHDLHIWGMSTTDVALTAHLTMPNGQPDDAFLHETAHALHHRFAIEHTTLQIERGDECGQHCVKTAP